MKSSSIRKSLKFLFIFFLTLSCYSIGSAQTPPSGGRGASQVFANIPLDVLDMLRPSIRLDMLDYYTQADSILTVQDALGGESRLVTVAPDYLKVAVTPVSTLEIKLLPYKKDHLVMTLYTVGADSLATDTQVKFFDANLNPIESSKFLKMPTLKDFFNLKDSELKESDLREMIPFEAIALSTGPGDTPLTATFTTLRTLSKESRDLLNPLLLPSLSSPWHPKFHFKKP